MTPNLTSALQHKIQMEHRAVVQAPWRSLPRKCWEAVEKEIVDILKLGMIEPSHSDLWSPIVLVPKPDGSIRFCINFREVNKKRSSTHIPCHGRTSCLSKWGKLAIWHPYT